MVETIEGETESKICVIKLLAYFLIYASDFNGQCCSVFATKFSHRNVECNRIVCIFFYQIFTS
jgi:hypothetical protein